MSWSPRITQFARHGPAIWLLRFRSGVVLGACSLLACTVDPPPPSHKPTQRKLEILVNEPPNRTPIESAGLFFVLYQDAVPGSKDGTIDVARTVSEIRRQASLPKFGMLDFEDPFTEVLRKGSTHPLHRTVVDSMIETIRAVRKAFPATKWAFWGFPEIPFWLDGVTGKDWATASDSQRDCAMRDAMQSHRELLLECDWVAPWAYDLFELRSAGSAALAHTESAGAVAWFKAKVTIARSTFAEARRPAPPIIPCISLLYAPGGRAPSSALIPIEEFRSDLVEPILAMPVDGIALWTPLAYFSRLASKDASETGEGDVAKSRDWIRKHLRDGREPAEWTAEQRSNDGLAHALLARYVRAIADSAARGSP